MREIRMMLKEAGLGQYWDELKYQILPGFYMVPKMTDEADIKLGASKIGGHPDVPSTFQWPSWKTHPMSFVAQINLEEFPMNLVNPEYPATGILYFFYVYDYEVWYNDDYDSDMINNNVVYYVPETAELVRMKPPASLSEEQIFKSALLEKKLELTLPDSDYLEANHLMTNKADLNRYSLEFKPDFMNTYDRGIGFRFLGHMSALQYGGHPSDEILLFQADSNDEIGMEWDLSGLLYFFIKDNDFKKLFFENVYTYRVGT
ncbi:DUF1963 domain-containing protein [Paenibacillus ihuae]|uniref:DUF1963 domain-containing protein n=1 Tax=Paenibacillus ihuae TaxID=1232431 RepID=UPI00131CA177|nr:YwqG family protein [Paenibacillus ihuae]